MDPLKNEDINIDPCLKHHFNSEDTREDIVKVVEYFIAV